MPHEVQAGPETLTPQVMPETLPESDFLADAAQVTANFLCAIRPFQAADISKDIITENDYRSWKLAGKFALAVAFDIADGMLARFAAKRRGGETTPTGARLDELADKSLTHLVMGAIAVRAGMDGDSKYQKFILDNQSTIAGRDYRITKKRNEAQALDVEVKAQSSGKKKTRRQNAAIMTMLSPVMNSRLGRFAARRLQKQATRLALESEDIYMKNFDEGIAQAQQPATV